jgi:hypothetical protein
MKALLADSTGPDPTDKVQLVAIRRAQGAHKDPRMRPGPDLDRLISDAKFFSLVSGAKACSLPLGRSSTPEKSIPLRRMASEQGTGNNLGSIQGSILLGLAFAFIALGLKLASVTVGLLLQSQPVNRGPDALGRCLRGSGLQLDDLNAGRSSQAK